MGSSLCNEIASASGVYSFSQNPNQNQNNSPADSASWITRFSISPLWHYVNLFLHIQTESSLPLELMLQCGRRVEHFPPFLWLLMNADCSVPFSVIFLRLNTPRSFRFFFRSWFLHSNFCFFSLQYLWFLHLFYKEEYVRLGVVCWLKSHLCGVEWTHCFCVTPTM